MKRLWPAALVLLTPAVLFPSVLVRSRSFAGTDSLRVYAPTYAFWSEELRHGRLPAWFPYDGFGQPLWGNVVLHPFHPVHLLALLLPPFSALDVATLACFPCMLLGAALLWRRLGLGPHPSAVGAALYGLNGYALSMTSNFPYLLALTTVPFALAATAYLLEAPGARRAALVALSHALVLLAGDPGAFVLCAAGSGLLALCAPRGTHRRARLAWTGVGLAVGALVAGVQITTSLALRHESIVALRSVDEAQVWSLHPARWLDLFFGPVWASADGDPVLVARSLLKLGGDALWSRSVYVGALSCALALAAWADASARRRLLAWAGALLAVLALLLGRNLPVYGLAYRWVPGWQLFRYPEKLFPFAVLALSFLTAHGAQLLERGDRRATCLARSALGLCAVAAGAVALAPLGVLRHAGVSWDAAPGLGEVLLRLAPVLGAHALRVALASCAGAAVLFAVPRDRRLPALTLVLAADLLVAGRGLSVTAPRRALQQPPALATAIWRRQTEPPTRVYSAVQSLDPADEPSSTEAALLPDVSALFGLESGSVYFQGASLRVAELLRMGRKLWWSRLMSRGDVGFAVVGADSLRGGSHRGLARDDRFGYGLLQNPARRGRAYFAAARCASSMDEARELLASPDLRPDEAVVECRGQGFPASVPANAEVKWERREPTELVLRTRTDGPGTLMLADAFYSGWEARVDGRPALLAPVDLAFRAVAVPAGAHTVELRYAAPGFRLGMLLTGLGLLCCVVMGLAGGPTSPAFETPSGGGSPASRARSASQ